MTARVLTPWTRLLWDAQCLHDGEPRPDTLVTLTRRRATSSDRWVQLQVEETGAHHYHVVEFLLLLQRLLAVDASLCEEELFAWVKEEQVGSPTAACQRKRCVGGCRLSGADADRSYSSAIVPCSRQGEHWARDDGVMMKPGSKTDTTAVVGVVLDFGESIDGAFVSLLVAAMRDPLGTNGLSDAFKTAFQMLTLSGLKPSSAELHLHLRLSALMPSTVSLRGLAASWSHLDSPGFCADGIDVAAASMNEFLTHVPTLPFTQLHVCASSSSSGRNNPLSAPTKPLDCTSLRLLLAKSQPSLQELDVCNVRLSSFDCITQAYTTGMCRLRALRLREFAMGVVSDGGIFAALRVPTSPITQTLEELEIDQALHSAGGLSFWLEREAGFMLLKNDRLTKCVIRQACSIYPNTTHKGFWQTRGREIRVPVPMSSKLALLSVLLPYKIPREVIVTILEFASRTVVRDTQMLYRPIMPDQLDRFMSDVDAWKPKSMVQYSELPYGSYYH